MIMRIQIGVNIFGMSSRKESMLIVVDPVGDVPLQVVADKFLGASVWIWPYNRESLVVGVSNNRQEVILKRGLRQLGPDESQTWEYTANKLSFGLKSTKAVDIGTLPSQ
jgi:hypothetical protein